MHKRYTLLGINDIQNSISVPVKSSIFADDITMFISGNNPNTSQHILQQALNQLINYTNKTGFKISKSKSQAIIFSKSNKKENIELKIINSK